METQRRGRSATSSHVGEPVPSRTWVLSGTRVQPCQETVEELYLHVPSSPAVLWTPPRPETCPFLPPRLHEEPCASFTTSQAFLPLAPSLPLARMFRTPSPVLHCASITASIHPPVDPPNPLPGDGGRGQRVWPRPPSGCGLSTSTYCQRGTGVRKCAEAGGEGGLPLRGGCECTLIYIYLGNSGSLEQKP